MKNRYRGTLLSSALGFVIGRACLRNHRARPIERRHGVYVPRLVGCRHGIGGTNGRSRRSGVRTNTRGYGALSLILLVSESRRFLKVVEKHRKVLTLIAVVSDACRRK